MLSFFSWIFGKNLNAHLHETKKIKVRGVKFIIKRLNAINYLDGSKSLRANYDTYKTKGANAALDVDNKKIVEHFSHVLVNGVVAPKLSHTDDGTGIHVEQLFTDWDMVVELHNKIMEFTYGKKKMKLLTSQEIRP